MTSYPARRALRTPAASSASGHPARTSPSSTYFGLYALQHRGQESAGIAVSDGSSVLVYKDMGLVSQVFDEATLIGEP
jgi:glutamine phosphoribosylpyrophosphate amidotransferase